MRDILQFEMNQGQKLEFVKKRQQFTQQIRKQNREEILTKRRNNNGQTIYPTENTNYSQDMITIDYVVDKRFEEIIKKFQKSRFILEDLPELTKLITQPDIEKQHYGIIGIRKIMSLAEDPPIQVIIDYGIIPRLIQMVTQTEYPQLQLQATWSLANVASGTPQQCQTIIDKYAIEHFIKLLKSSYPGIVQQAIWALGNIASDSSFNRDAIIRKGGVQGLIFVLTTTRCQDLIQSGAWALSNLCRGTPLPNYQLVKEGVFVIAQLITNNKIKQQQTFADCCWSISFNFPKQKKQFFQIITKQLIFGVGDKLKREEPTIIVPAIRILGHITKLSDDYVDIVLQCPDIIDSFYNLLCFSKKTVRIQTLWVLSNISSGPQNHINFLLANELLINKILELFDSDSQQIKREICYVFANMSIQGNPQTIFRFFKQTNVLKYYIQALSSEDPKLVIDSLDNLDKILQIGAKMKNGRQNPFVVDIGNLGGLSIIEQLQFHDQQDVYQSVIKLMGSHFQMQDNLNF